MERVLFVFPTLWDARQLDACRHAWRGAVEPVLLSPADADCPWDFDLEGWIETLAGNEAGRVSGVASTSDYPGAAAAAFLAARLDLPGPAPEAILRASHKYVSRRIQAAAVPEAVPEFRQIDPDAPEDPLPFPYFVKPVKGSFSMLTRRIDGPGQLAAFLERPVVREFLTYYVDLMRRMLEWRPELAARADRFLAEELLIGDQVTVEGFVFGGRAISLGVVDSVLHPGTGSFLRFDYPSTLPPEVVGRMEEIACRAALALGLEGAAFNVELVRDPTGRICILEVNPRLCGQFADLHLEVDGSSSYEGLLDLARGVPPRRSRGNGRHRTASSYPLRVFEPTRVERMPDESGIRAVESALPGTRIWMEAVPGAILQDFESLDDGRSCRYGVINAAGDDREDVERRFREAMRLLDLRLMPARSPLSSRSG